MDVWLNRRQHERAQAIERAWRDLLQRDGHQAQVDLAACRAQLAEVVKARDFLQTSFDWLRTRVNQLERERAQLLSDRLGFGVVVPEIGQVPVDPTRTAPVSPEDLYSTAMFEDLGDEKAHALKLDAPVMMD